MSWLADDRAGVATERILDAAEELFAQHGVATIGMDAVARAAGCSRATLYRYFSNRRALLTAYAEREARRIVQKVTSEIESVTDPEERTTLAVIAYLREVRSRPPLTAWYGADPALLLDVLRESPHIEPFTARLVGDAAAPDRDLAHWVLRTIVSFLTAPGTDEDQEDRLVRRFISPFLTVRQPTAAT